MKTQHTAVEISAHGCIGSECNRLEAIIGAVIERLGMSRTFMFEGRHKEREKRRWLRIATNKPPDEVKMIIAALRAAGIKMQCVVQELTGYFPAEDDDAA